MRAFGLKGKGKPADADAPAQSCRRIGLDDVQISVVESSMGCPYFSAGERFVLSELIPSDMCPDLFFSAYPYAIGLAGRAWYNWMPRKNEVSAQCPAPTGKVATMITRTSYRRNGSDVVLEVRDSNPKACAYSHTAGDRFELEMKIPGCHHAFYAIYPYVRMLSVQDAEEPKDCQVRCSNASNRCVFSLTRQ